MLALILCSTKYNSTEKSLNAVEVQSHMQRHSRVKIQFVREKMISKVSKLGQ